MENSHQISISDSRKFIFAGNATFTLVSKRTGVRYTYRIKTPKGKPAPHFVSVLTGSDNENSYEFFGTVFDANKPGETFRHGRKTRISQEAPSVVAWNWFFHNLDSANLSACMEIHHEGKCCRCGRKLTVPESILSGIGPECASRM